MLNHKFSRDLAFGAQPTPACGWGPRRSAPGRRLRRRGCAPAGSRRVPAVREKLGLRVRLLRGDLLARSLSHGKIGNDKDLPGIFRPGGKINDSLQRQAGRRQRNLRKIAYRQPLRDLLAVAAGQDQIPGGRLALQPQVSRAVLSSLMAASPVRMPVSSVVLSSTPILTAGSISVSTRQ